jgi:hypothetical protein
MEQIIEVDATLVSSQYLQLRDSSNNPFKAKVDVFECINPYVLVFVITHHEHSLRMDIHKHDLAAEMRRWLEGSTPLHLVTLLSTTKRIDDQMMRFVKFGNPPAPGVLHKWILSRTELSWTESKLCFGGIYLFKDKDLDDDLAIEDDFIGRRLTSHLEHTSKSNTRRPSLNEFQLDVRDDSIFRDEDRDASSPSNFPETNSFRMKRTVDVDTSTFDLTRKLLGKSHALEMLKQTRKMTSKQRADAVSTVSIGSLSTEQYVLGADIEKTRKQIADAMEMRRRTIEIFKVRQQQTAAKYSSIRESIKLSKQVCNFNSIELSYEAFDFVPGRVILGMLSRSRKS